MVLLLLCNRSLRGLKHGRLQVLSTLTVAVHAVSDTTSRLQHVQAVLCLLIISIERFSFCVFLILLILSAQKGEADAAEKGRLDLDL